MGSLVSLAGQFVDAVLIGAPAALGVAATVLFASRRRPAVRVGGGDALAVLGGAVALSPTPIRRLAARVGRGDALAVLGGAFAVILAIIRRLAVRVGGGDALAALGVQLPFRLHQCDALQPAVEAATHTPPLAMQRPLH